jgi:hypothetical protein
MQYIYIAGSVNPDISLIFFLKHKKEGWFWLGFDRFMDVFLLLVMPVLRRLLRLQR